MASIVVMRLPVTAETGVMHERTGLPSTWTLCVFPLTVMVNAMTVPPFLPTTQETQMGSDQKGEGESIGRWYRSVRRCQSARQSCCTRSPATTPRYDGRSPAEWRIVARWRHG